MPAGTKFNALKVRRHENWAFRAVDYFTAESPLPFSDVV